MPTESKEPVSLIDCLFACEVENPLHDAVVTPEVRLSYAELAQLVRAQASEFLDAGITGKSVIGIRCADDTQHLVFCLAAIQVGATSCTIPSHETNEAQQATIDLCGAIHVVDQNLSVSPLSQDYFTESAAVDRVAPQAQLLFSTSGTTGEPKLVVFHDSDLVKQAHRHIGSRQERFVCLASMEHNFVKRHRLYCVAAGATNVILDGDRESLVAQCLSLNVNVLHVSAFQAQELLAIADVNKLSTIRLKLGGSHVPLPLRQQLQNNITANLQAGYGTTETGAIGFTDPDDTNAGESVGQPLPGIELRTVAPDGKPLGRGKHGELAIRCDGMFRGYLNNPGLTATRLKDGWFYTGDIGYQDNQQRIHLCGRSDDMFVFNSMNIYPQDIESQICQHPDVIDAAVMPKKSAAHGNIPVALVVFDESVTPNLPALKKFVRKRAGIRSPRQYNIVANIPRNATGKIARHNVMGLSKTIDQVRSSIVQALNECETKPLKPSLVTAFENGEKDIRLYDLGMDSLARMNLLIELEIDLDVVITPLELARFRTLEDIVSRVISKPEQPKLEKSDSPQGKAVSTARICTETPPHVVRLFQRVFGLCHTAVQLHKAIATLEYRLTPMKFECLREWHLSGKLIPADAAEKFQTPVSHWIDARQRTLLDSGKQEPEPYILRRISPAAYYCTGPGSPADKTLIVCFATRGSHQLSIPNAALMQHTDAARYDLLIIAEPLNAGYWIGVPWLGKSMGEVIEWISKLDLIRNYNSVRTLGCSAGGYPAVVAGYLLRAEMAVCVGGRFHTIRQPIRILEKLFTTWRAVRKGNCVRVILSYSADESRDRQFVRTLAGVTKASRVTVEFTNERAEHGILTQLLRRGELAPYLQRTIFAEMEDELIAADRANTIMSFPTIQLRPQG